jgi:hypothetical protein
MPKTNNLLLSETKANELKTRMLNAKLSGSELTRLYSTRFEQVSQSTVSGILSRRITCSESRLSNFDKIIRKYEKIAKYAEKVNG